MATIKFSVTLDSDAVAVAVAAVGYATRAKGKGRTEAAYTPSDKWMEKIRAAYPSAKISDATDRLTGVAEARKVYDQAVLAFELGEDLSSVTLPLSDGGSVGFSSLRSAIKGESEAYVG